MVDSSLLLALDGEPSEHAKARDALLALGERAVGPLIQVMEHGSPRAARAAADILGDLRGDTSFTALCAAVRSPNPVLSSVSVKALLRFEGKDLLPFLLDALPAVPTVSQQSILNALQRLQDQRAVPALLNLLQTTDSPTLRVGVIQSLIELNAASALPVILQFERDANHHVRDWVQEAVERLGEPRNN